MSLFSGEGGFISTITAPYELWRNLGSVQSLVEDPRKTTLDINAALDKLVEEISNSIEKDKALPRGTDGKVSVGTILDYLDTL